MGEVLGLGREVRMLYMVRLSHPIGRRDLGTRARANMCKIQRVSFQSKRLRRSVEPRRGANRRNLGTRIRYPNESYSTNKPSAIAALCKKSPPPQSTQKLPPRAPAPNIANQISSPQRRVLVGGSSGRMREAWREKGHPPKGGPFSLQGLFPLLQAYTLQGGDEDEGKD